ncbi:protein of unknown function [Streptomyces zhaozhouensis]|uniref:Protein kinase domain-containing protein n=2 Tax=Streptomyces zhaozhouensis TaxID=1300267 RepID=A0A286E932_9ACTN|nr:protein of unknown function [Streptomyces zhaozhouensis]
MVAVKSIRLELATSPDFRLRFAEEVAIAQRVGGEWTAAVLDADPHAERPWVATAYVPGPTLAEVVARHGPLPERSVRGLASGLCDALADIHDAGLIHRDLKPSNIMITINGPKVIDFGIVRALDGPTHGGLTSTGVIVGSPGFMAPEQVRGERLTTACDIFSLGSVLAFAASGRLPFGISEAPPHALMYRVVHEEPDLSGIPEPLLPLIRDCLIKDPAARPPLTALRARDETQFQHLGPWLPAPVLARLGQDAAQLLEQEDPRTGLTGSGVRSPASPPQDETLTAPGHRPAASVTAPVTATDLPDHQGQPQRGTPVSPSTLAEERNGSNGPRNSTIAVYVALVLYTLAVLGPVVTQFILMMGTYSGGFEYRLIYENQDHYWGFFQLGTAVVLAVAWLNWFVRMRTTTEKLAPGRLRYPPAMAAVSWFIPFGNLYLPKQIANDVWRASSPPSATGVMAPAYWLHAWWGLWLVTLLTSPLYAYWDAFNWATRDHINYTRSPGFRVGDGEEVYALEPNDWWAMLLRLLAFATVVATAMYVSRLTALQRTLRPEAVGRPPR